MFVSTVKLTMKSILILTLLFVYSLMLTTTTKAQSTVKEMDKETKSELKEYIKNPNSYRKMVSNFKEQLEADELKVTELQEAYYKVEYLSVQAQDSIDVLNDKLSKMGPLIAPLVADETTSGAGTTIYANNGTDYRVQIGAYQFFDFTQLCKFNQPIGFEKVDEITNYYLGSWGSADEAYEFSKAIRKLKIKDAFVSKYVNGSRVPYDHLLEMENASKTFSE